MDLTTDSSFASLYSSPSHFPSKGRRRPRFLKTLKSFAHGSNEILTGWKCPKNGHPEISSQDSGRPHAWPSLWKRRGQTPGMDDYLTLEQLENVWYNQDFYVGCVSVPQMVTKYTFTEAVEAPLIADHDSSARQPRPRPNPNSPSSSPPHHDPTVIDGSVHPALRPTPYLEDSPIILKHHPATTGRRAVAVPTTNWTYGRD